MTKLPCPSCGGEIQFRSNMTVFAVCSYCLSTVVRHDNSLEEIGKMSELLDDMSPFQIGTTGICEGRPFELIGRVQISWEDGFWNEWYAHFGTGKYGWLAEAQGELAFNFPCARKSSLPTVNEIEIGQEIKISDKNFSVEDIKKVTCVGSEGELPFKAIHGRQSVSVDLGNENGEFACIDYSDDEGVSVYLGNFVEIDELKLKNLKEIEGWI